MIPKTTTAGCSVAARPEPATKSAAPLPASAALQALIARTGTTLVDSEYKRLLRWRERYLDPERDEGDHEFLEDHPVAAQVIAYLIAEAETLRDFHAKVEAALQGIAIPHPDEAP